MPAKIVKFLEFQKKRPIILHIYVFGPILCNNSATLFARFEEKHYLCGQLFVKSIIFD